MRNHFNKQILLVIGLFSSLSILFSSCATLVPFSQSLQKQYNLKDDDLHKIQFYNSDDILLYKDVSSSGRPTIQGGKIKVIDGREVEEITIKSLTKGIVANSDASTKKLGISYEINDNYYLSFGENPKFNNKYCLYASNWGNNLGEVTYNGEKYNTPTQSGRVYLLVDVRKLQKLNTKTRVAKGRKIK
ncbi:MAG: hypothetical protein WCP57_07215 [Bacteroidota bacterium]